MTRQPKGAEQRRSIYLPVHGRSLSLKIIKKDQPPDCLQVAAARSRPAGWEQTAHWGGGGALSGWVAAGPRPNVKGRRAMQSGIPASARQQTSGAASTLRHPPLVHADLGRPETHPGAGAALRDWRPQWPVPLGVPGRDGKRKEPIRAPQASASALRLCLGRALGPLALLNPGPGCRLTATLGWGGVLQPAGIRA